jgi:hypothetical protein
MNSGRGSTEMTRVNGFNVQGSGFKVGFQVQGSAFSEPGTMNPEPNLEPMNPEPMNPEL